MGKQCKYAKVGKGFLYGAPDHCYCTSSGNQNSSKGNQVKRSDGTGYPITGHKSNVGGWWSLCIGGRNHKGVTPSRCGFYR